MLQAYKKNKKKCTFSLQYLVSVTVVQKNVSPHNQVGVESLCRSRIPVCH